MQVYKLGKLCKVGSSKRIHLSDYVSEGVPFYRSKEVIELANKKNISETLFISQEKFNEIKQKFPVPCKNDILITSVGTIGIPYLVENENFYFKDGNLTWLRDFDENLVDINFIFYFLKSNSFKKQVLNNNIGAVQKALTIDYLRTVNVNLPIKTVQKKIASVLSNLDKKIELNNQINATLEQMAKTLYDYWFVQFDFPDDNGKPYKSSGGEMVYNETLKRDIPKGWEVKTLNSLGEIVGGSTPSTTKAENFSLTDGTPWITPNDLSQNQGNKYIARGETNVTNQGIIDASLKKYPAGTVLMSSRAPIGYMAIARKEVTTNQGFKSFIPNKGYDTEFVYYAVLNSMKAITQSASGSTFKEISTTVLKGIPVVLPPKERAKTYIEKASEIFSQQNNLEQQNAELTKLRDWLLPMLMNGQATVQ